MQGKKLYYGKYRGKVENNMDIMFQGRLQVSCPAVLGEGRMSWAMPSTPYAGPGVGFFALPPTGANVWVEFEGGDPDYPIWSGCFWGMGESPVMLPTQTMIKMLKTDSVTVEISDVPGAGGVKIDIAAPAVAVPISIICDSKGVEVTCNPAVFTLTPQKIESTLGPVATTTLSPSGIELASTPAKVTLSSSAIEASHAPSTVAVKPAAIELANGPSTVAVKPAAIELANGASAVKLSPANVKIN